MGGHVSAQDGIDAGLLAALLAEPIQQVLVQPHGYHGFSGGPDELGVLPEVYTRGVGVRVRCDATANFRITHAAQTVPICGAPLKTRRAASTRAFPAPPIAKPR